MNSARRTSSFFSRCCLLGGALLLVVAPGALAGPLPPGASAGIFSARIKDFVPNPSLALPGGITKGDVAHGDFPDLPGRNPPPEEVPPVSADEETFPDGSAPIIPVPPRLTPVMPAIPPLEFGGSGDADIRAEDLPWITSPGDGNIGPNSAVVPTPGTVCMLVMGAGALGLRRRR